MKKLFSTLIGLLAVLPLFAADGVVIDKGTYRWGNFITNYNFQTNVTFANQNTLMLSAGEVGLTIAGKMHVLDTNEVVAGTTYASSSTNVNIVKTNLQVTFVVSQDGSNWTTLPFSVGAYALYGSNYVTFQTNFDNTIWGWRYIKPYQAGLTNAIAATNRITIDFLRWGVFRNPND